MSLRPHAQVSLGGQPVAAAVNAVTKADQAEVVQRKKTMEEEGRLLWLDVIEDGCNYCIRHLAVVVFPAANILRLWFNLSLCFYGDEFRVFAFHLLVFRLAGYQKVTSQWQKLVKDYRAARNAVVAAKYRVRHTKGLLRRQEKIKKYKEAMMVDMQAAMQDGTIRETEALAFGGKYQSQIAEIQEVEAELAAYTSSMKALRKAISLKTFLSSLDGLYSAAITSITASTFMTAGKITLVLTAESEIRAILIAVFKPIVDPVGFRLEMDDGYIATSQNDEVLLYITIASTVLAGLLYILFQHDVEEALRMTMVLVGSGVVTQYGERAVNLVRRRWLHQRVVVGSPSWRLAQILLAMFGYLLHRAPPQPIPMICLPFIKFLDQINEFLCTFKTTAVGWFR